MHDGVPVPGSNVTDLVNNLLRQRRNPVGWQLFAQQLRRISLPMELIGNVDRRHYLRQTTATATPLKQSRIPRWTPLGHRRVEPPKRSSQRRRFSLSLSGWELY